MPRLLERVREMVQDAAQKGERLSAAGERVSRAAERLVRDLEVDVGEIRGLIARLAPPAPREEPVESTPESDPPLRLLDRQESASPWTAPPARRPGIAEESP